MFYERLHPLRATSAAATAEPAATTRAHAAAATPACAAAPPAVSRAAASAGAAHNPWALPVVHGVQLAVLERAAVE